MNTQALVEYRRQYDRRKQSGWLDTGQNLAMLAGTIDPTGVIDGLNAGVYGARALFDPKNRASHLANAGVSALGMIPYLGDAAKATKLGPMTRTFARSYMGGAGKQIAAKRLGNPLGRVGEKYLSKGTRTTINKYKTPLNVGTSAAGFAVPDAAEAPSPEPLRYAPPMLAYRQQPQYRQYNRSHLA